MNITKDTVTPKKAMEWLKRNVHNRPLSQTTVGQYAKAMQQSAWKLNGDAIRFNGNGDLIDGQHRLAGCIKAGVSFESYVIRGLDHDAFDTIDQGKRRSIADVFARDGYKNYSTLAAATRWHWLYAKNFKRFGESMRPDEAHDIIEENPSLHHAAALAMKMYQQQKLMQPGLLAWLIFETGKEDQDRADKFWSSAILGEGLVKDTPAHRLHKRLVGNVAAYAKLTGSTVAAISVKAWNAYVSRKPTGVLKWVEGEDFPTIKH